MRKSIFLKILFCFVFSFFIAFFSSDIEVFGINYEYQKGNVTETYKKVDVISFNYDYITYFDEDIFDGSINVKGEKFYSGKSITLQVDHYNTWVPFVKEDDVTNIYKYDSNIKGFDSKIDLFDNEEGTYNFNVEGIYKIEYVFEDEVVYVKYVYISKSLNYASVVGDSRYKNTSAYSNFSFNFTLKDAYNLKKNSYYYAFGVSASGLKFREFSVFSEEELSASKAVNEINRDILVDINDSDVTVDNAGKYLYVKIVNENNSETIVKTEDAFLLASKIEANVYLVDDNGKFINEHSFYKAGDKIKFKVILNADVTFENLQFTINGYKFMDIANMLQVGNEFEIIYTIASVENFVGKFNLKSKYSSNAIVRNNGINAILGVVSNADFEVDVTKPGITFLEEGGVARKEYIVPVVVDEPNISLFSYYVSRCVMAQGNKCLDSFNEKDDRIVNLESVANYSVKIDENIGEFNGENLALFVKVVDRAGNVSTFAKMGYIIDNVIVDMAEEESLFDFVDIFNGTEMVGKRLNVLLYEEDAVTSVSYEFENGDKEVCYYENAVLGKEVYNCFGVEGYDFNAKLKVNILDEYGNFESYVTDFKFSTMVDASFMVGDKVFNSFKEEKYDLEYNVFNYMKNNDESIVFDDEVLNALYEELNFSKIPNLSNLHVSLVYIDGDDLIVLEDNVVSNLVLPTAQELVVLLNGVDKIKYCSIEKCDIDMYLKYEYKVNGIVQTRLVKISYLDSTNKYFVNNFNVINKVNVGEKFVEFSYRYISNLNVEINKDDVNMVKKITFEDNAGNVSVVDSIDTSLLGKYTVTESFTYGSTGSFPLSYIVEVVDSIAPLIRLKGKERIVIRVGETFVDPLVSVSDNYDKELKVESKIEPVLDVNVEGVYVISYWCVDSNGNVSDTVTRTVVVLKESSKETYLISGGIVFVTIMMMVVSIIVEVRKQKRIRKQF